MGTNYNITPKQFNGSDYDTLYFKNTSQQVLLNDSDLAEILGLSGTPNVNEALNKILTSTVDVVEYDGKGIVHADSSNPKSIEIDFVPKVVIIGVSGSAITWSALGIFPYNGTGMNLGTSDGTLLTVTWTTISNGHTTMSWFAPSSTQPWASLDDNGAHYYCYCFR